MQDTLDSGRSYRAGYPLFLDVRGHLVTVIGGGAVAERKVTTLLPYGALIHVVSPQVTDSIRDLAEQGEVRWTPRAYEEGDLQGSLIAFCACGDAQIEKLICAEAKRVGCPINVVDVPERCDFIVPSIVERGPLRIAVSTSGAAPTEAKAIRRHLEEEYDESWSGYLHLMGRVRDMVKQRVSGGEERRRAYFEAATAAGFRERLAAGEAITAEDAFREVAEAVAKEAC